MSGKSVRRAALALLVAVLLGVAAPIPASAQSGESTTASFFTQVWDWLRTLWPDPVLPAGDGDAGYGVDPNG
ncbi:MAG TPA: hypothetical protein VN493_22745 [Thermoanaerobaculia bacterium]|nr:hypothetical protein [Thermoanaerobaculia bacterium]